MKILILIAHPDDEVIMCGATIDKLIKRGRKVHVAFFTRNDQAFFGKETQEERRKRTVKEALRSSKLLGYSTSFLNLQDMQLQQDKGMLIQMAMREIRQNRPDLIITHHERDKHIDHRTLGEVVPEANFQSGCRLSGGDKVWSAKAVLQGEVDLEMTTPFDFQIVSSVSSRNVDQKIRAFKCYASVKDEHKTSQKWLLEKLRICAQLRGKAVGLECGEAFMLNNHSPLNSESLKIISRVIA